MRILKRIASLLLAVSVLVSPVYGADEGTSAKSKVAVSYDAAEKMVYVRGNANGYSTIKVLPSNMQLSDVTPLNLYTHFDQIYGTGSLDYEFVMPDGTAYKKYAVYLNDGSSTENVYDTFMYYDKATADTIVQNTINKSAKNELNEKIDQNATNLGIDKSETIYIDNAENSAQFLFDYYVPLADSSDFYKSYNSLLVMNEMKGLSQSEIEDLLMEYQSSLGIDFDIYNSLSNLHKSDISSLLSKMNFNDELSNLKSDGKDAKFSEIFDRTEALSAVRTSENWQTIKTVFTETYSSVLSEIINANSDYATVLANDVYIQLATGTYDTYQDLKTGFNNAVSAVKQSYAVNSKPSAGGGGGSTGGGVGVPSENKTPKDEFDETSASQNGTESGGKTETSFTMATLSGNKAEYSDVNVASWEYSAVSSLGGDGIISGYEDGSFKSSKPITRAEFTKLIVSAFSIKAEGQPFSDVSENTWYYPYVSVAAGSGIVNGYDGIFNPDANISRQDATVIIYRLSEKLGKNYYGNKTFLDINDVSLYAVTAVMGLGSMDIINGDNSGRFNPKKQLTRAEAAQIIYNFIIKLNE